MLDIEDFDAVFPNKLAYSHALSQEIIHCRKTLGGRSFFERLLELLQIKWRKAYPPSHDGLRDLHERIVKAPIALHYKHCLLLYLLKDLSPIYRDQTDIELASSFARNVHLEKKFWTFIEGLWSLDHLQFDTAVNHLTHPSIIPTFPDEIMLVLLNHRKEQTGPNNGDVLPLAYYNCANPPLASQEVKTEFIRYMAERNVTETLYWIRARPEYEHRQLLEAFVEETLERSQWARSHSNEQGYPREEMVAEFVGLPFTDEEETWLEGFLTEGKGRNFKNAADTLTMRRIATGRLAEVARDATVKGRRIEGVNWDILRDGVGRGLGPRKD
ncbi:hypothetical protein BU24DRAFT_421376 [Aaosphaeria arxii CBS 175.79]|uniref:ELYS-like domain-containing protein n=1 Tax=Aaosphaeria arxii CBS 175.79 TaxID=1450172 RepID=A0A6A5Y0D6_9PLEO|nr:uncharacterized protein BU24DRAFT_421376 [Aaosphaeria arxii CBS 175.79]KAF2018391.1 hypothetical protein BU24DRAFT_421376 [Aaosphaeria arxii CBS 175.79]